MKTIILVLTATLTCGFSSHAQERGMQDLKVLFEKGVSKESFKEPHQALVRCETIKNPFSATQPSAKLKAMLAKYAVRKGKGDKQTLQAVPEYSIVLVSDNTNVISRYSNGSDTISDYLKPTKFANGGDTMNDYLKPTKVGDGGDTMMDYLKPTKFGDGGDTMMDYLKPTTYGNETDTASGYLTFTDKVGIIFLPKSLEAHGLERIQAQLIEKGDDYEVWQWVDKDLKPQPEHILIFGVE